MSGARLAGAALAAEQGEAPSEWIGQAGRSLGVVPTSPLSRPLGQSAKCAILEGR